MQLAAVGFGVMCLLFGIIIRYFYGADRDLELEFIGVVVGGIENLFPKMHAIASEWTKFLLNLSHK